MTHKLRVHVKFKGGANYSFKCERFRLEGQTMFIDFGEGIERTEEFRYIIGAEVEIYSRKKATKRWFSGLFSRPPKYV